MPFVTRASTAALVSAWLAVAAAYLVALQAPAAGTFHDDGIYLVTARALAEGQSYRIISLPAEPVQTKYPILFPWLVSLVWRLNPSFPENLPWLRLIPLFSTVAWLGVTWRLLRRLGASEREARFIPLMTAASPWVWFLSTTVMSETLFAALFTASVLMMARMHDGDGGRWDGVLAGLLAGASVLTRTAGLAMVGAGLIWCLLRAQWKAAAHYLAGALVAGGPWFLWVAQHNARSATVDAYNSSAPYGSWNIVFGYAWPEKLVVLTSNAVYAATAFVQIWTLPPVPWLWGAAVFCTVAVLRGLWMTGPHPMVLLVVVYALMVLAWVWPPVRFIAPLAPLLLWLVWLPCRTAAGKLAAPIAGALLVAAVLQLSGGALHVAREGTTWPSPASADDWRQVAPLLEWIAHKTPPDAVLAGNLDPQYYLYTQRKAVRPFAADPYGLYYDPRQGSPLGTVAGLRDRLLSHGVDYLVLTPNQDYREMPYLRELVHRLQKEIPGGVSPVAGDPVTGYVVFRLDRARLRHPADGRGDRARPDQSRGHARPDYTPPGLSPTKPVVTGVAASRVASLRPE